MTIPPQPGQPGDPAEQPAQSQPDPYAQPQQPSYPPPAQQPYAPPGAAHPPQQPAYDPPTGQIPQQNPYGPGQPQNQHYDLYSGQQPAYAAPAPIAKNKTGLYAAIGGGTAVFVVLVIVLVLALSGGGPGDRVDGFLEATRDLDVEGAREYVCDLDSDLVFDEEDLDTEEERQEAEEAVADLDWEIIEEHEAGDEATVRVKLISSSFLSGTADFHLEKRDGDWFICDVGSAD